MISPEQLKDYDPNQILIVTTGSQAEPRAQLTMASTGSSSTLKIQPNDLVLYRCAACLGGKWGRVEGGGGGKQAGLAGHESMRGRGRSG